VTDASTADPPRPARAQAPYRAPILLAAAATGALCGIVYELLLASLASYLIGGTVVVFSLTVGLFLASMGFGAWVSRFVQVRLLEAFIGAEMAIGLLGGVLPMALFAIYAVDGPFLAAHGLATVLVGSLVGLELPLLTRMLEEDGGLRLAISRALALDYLGALAGSVLFPLLLLPLVGLLGTALLVGATGPALAAAVAWSHRRRLDNPRATLVFGVVAALALAAGVVPARWLGDLLEDSLHEAPVVYRAQTDFQRVVVTRHGHDIRLFLDGDLQFSAVDEHRYHEALVHPALSSHPSPRRVLVLGAGDGLAVREVLRYPEVEEIVLVELDPGMTAIARRPPLARLNQGSLDDPRVKLVHADAFVALAERAPPLDRPFHVILADFPDPDAEAVARLYSVTLYQRLLAVLAPDGVFATQATSAFQTPRAFFCIGETLAQAGLPARPYLVDVPSFGGPWGFWIASPARLPPPDALSLRVPTRFLTDRLLGNLFDLPRDLTPPEDLRPNRLLDPVILAYHTLGGPE
jgi:spermidine synthase